MTQLKHQIFLPVYILFCICLCVKIKVEANPKIPTDKEALEVLVKQWQDLQLQRQKEQTNWMTEKQKLVQLLVRLESDSTQLEQQLKDAKKEHSGIKHQNDALALKKIQNQKILNELRNDFLSSGNVLLSMLSQQPEFVKKQLQQDIIKLKDLVRAGGGDESVLSHQHMLTLLTEFQLLLLKFHVSEEILQFPGGQRQKSKILYLGTACAFALSADNQTAMRGVQVSGNWSWSPIPQTKELRDALSIAQGERIATLVHLPLPQPNQKQFP